jgi:type I restriction-modification system DNA methylase subunit
MPIQIESTKEHSSLETNVLEKFHSSRKNYGLFFTPDHIVDFMVEISGYQTGKVLEPACGLGQFLARIIKRSIFKNGFINVEQNFLGVEINKDIAREANNYINSYLNSNGFEKEHYDLNSVLNKNTC